MSTTLCYFKFRLAIYIAKYDNVKWHLRLVVGVVGHVTQQVLVVVKDTGAE